VVHWPLRTSDIDSSRRAVARNLVLDVIGALGIGATGALVSVLLPTIARRGGVDPIGLAALTATPFLANLLSAWAGRFGPRTPVQLALIRAGGAAALLFLLVLPLPPAMLVIVLVYMLALSFTNPFQMRLWGALYPNRLIGRVLGLLGMSRAAAAAVAALVGGVAADALGVPVVIAFTGVLGFASAIAYAGQRARSSEHPPAYSARQSIRALRERATLSQAAVAQGFFGGGLIAAVPLYALVHVDRLHLSLAEVGGIGILISAATTVSFPLWGMLSDRRGPLATLRVGSLLGIVALAGYAVAPTVTILWPVALALGTANASIDVGLGTFLMAETPHHARAAAQAGWNAITGARGIVAAFLMSALVSVGVVSVAAGLLLCAASAAIGVVLFYRIRPATSTTAAAASLAPDQDSSALPVLAPLPADA
jgi:MFS family permease